MQQKLTAIDYLADWTPIEDKLEPLPDDDPINVEGIGAIPPEALSTLLRLFFTRPPKSPRDWRAATIKLAVVSHAILPEVGGQSFAELGKQVGCSRAALSHYSTALRDFAHLGHRVGKSDESRAKLSAATKLAWKKRKAGGGVNRTTKPANDSNASTG